ncbi:Putative anthocyanidin reductase [Linum grandiflorum]
MSRVIYVMESVEEKGNEEGNRRRYCVTGANGYIGSYLVKLLLQSGASVHATLRNPSDNSVQRHLLPFWESSSGSNNNNRLHLFKADLQDPGSFDDAVNGCHGVFHVAASMQFHIPPSTGDNSVDHYVDTNIINPAIQGTLNLLRSCSKSSSSVKRLVFTSSISTLTGKNPDGSWKRVVDETCQASVNLTRSNRASGWVYALSKLLTEEAAFQYCKEKGIELVSVVTSTVAGPFLTTSPVAPSSIRVLMSPVTGDSSFFSILSAVSERMGSIALVHSQDVCSAHLFLMEHPSAQALPCEFKCSGFCCAM